MSDIPATSEQKQQRTRVRRTLWVMGSIAFTIYAAFILRGVLGA